MSLWDISRHGAIAVATFNRPPRNFMSFAAMGDLHDTVADLAADDSVNVIVLTGGVAGYFVAHADLDDLGKLGRGEPVDGDPSAWGRTLALIESCPQPVVAAVNGQAWGGGCELSLACTLRVVAASGHFAQPEVNVGIIPGAGGTQRLPRLIPPAVAAELVLSGRVVAAEEAVRLGLANAVLPDDGFVDHVVEWLQPIVSKPRHALIAAKRALIEGLRLPLADGLRLESELFIACQTDPGTLGLQDDARARYRDAGETDQVSL